ncbi:MAG: hypothetical protein KIT57_24310 [Blastocatellales bacterium]|nr:hypothetical protein [Blastocatellales bacterium]
MEGKKRDNEIDGINTVRRNIKRRNQSITKTSDKSEGGNRMLKIRLLITLGMLFIASQTIPVTAQNRTVDVTKLDIAGFRLGDNLEPSFDRMVYLVARGYSVSKKTYITPTLRRSGKNEEARPDIVMEYEGNLQDTRPEGRVNVNVVTTPPAKARRLRSEDVSDTRAVHAIL